MNGNKKHLQTSKHTLREQYTLIKNSLSHLIAAKKVIHIDIPSHLNIGDLLIDRATEKFIIDSNARCIARYSFWDIDRLTCKNIDHSTTLLLHGGGNFGDLYPRHQNLRTNIVDSYPDNPIIILPQTLHYKDQSIIEKDARTFNRHKNLKICMRDQVSYNELSKYVNTDKLLLLPDMAVALVDEVGSAHKTSNNTLLFRRRDIESPASFKTDNTFDWEDLVSESDSKNLHRSRRNLRKSNSWLRFSYGHFLQKKLRDILIERAISHFQQYSIIDSNRLHGIILAQLLQIPTIPRDNSYGKNNRYCETWLNEQA